MASKPHSTLARLDAHNRGGREYTREAMERDLRNLVEQLETLRNMAEGLFQMIDRETWRAHGGDDQQGHYEGDYRAAQIEEYLVSLRPSNPATCPNCGHDAHTPRYCVIHDCACGEPDPASEPESYTAWARHVVDGAPNQERESE